MFVEFAVEFRAAVAAMVLLFSAVNTMADYAVHLESRKGHLVSVRPGETFPLDIVLRSDGKETHNSSILRLTFSAPGLIYEGYAWSSPYNNEASDDASRPVRSELPVVLDAQTLSGAGYPAGAVDLELSNVTAGLGNIDLFGDGVLVSLTFRVPNDYSGPAVVDVHVEPETIAKGFQIIPGYAANRLVVAVNSMIIHAQPSSQLVIAGQDAALSFEVSALQPVRFEWFKDNALLADQTGPTLPLPKITREQAGEYWAVASDGLYSIRSDTAIVQVNSSPVLLPIARQVSAPGSLLELSIAATDPDLPADELIFDLDAGAPAGAAIDPATGLFTWRPADIHAPGTHLVIVRVSDGRGGSDSRTFEIDVTAIAPAITSEPQNLTVFAGSDVEFMVSAEGTPPLSFQWQRNGVQIPGATNQVLSLANVVSVDAGEYKAQVSGPGGSVSSRAAQLTVREVVSEPRVSNDGTFHFRVEIPPGRKAKVQVSADFITWIDFIPEPLEGNSIEVSDSAAAQSALRFYRVVVE